MSWELRRCYGRTPTLDPVCLSVGVFRRTHRRADLDNFLKAVMDAGNGIVWADDSQITDAAVTMRFDPDRSRVEVVAWLCHTGICPTRLSDMTTTTGRA